MTNNSTAAGCLTGLTLENGWCVVREIERSLNDTGGAFSHSYQVEKGDEVGFLKAFDFSFAFQEKDTTTALGLLISAYNHEREVLQLCNQRRLSKVVIAIDHGHVQIPGMPSMEGRVFYLIFHMADGDIRTQIDEKRKFDTLWSIRALKDACLGLWQIHKQMIAHQDIKPSNILLFRDTGEFRISDFGRSSQQGRNVFHDEYTIAGDRVYAPPELLYEFRHQEFTVRRFGCDLYMLGNLAAFLFSGVNMTASLLSHLSPEFHPGTWTGTYQDVLPYLQEAFTRVLEDLSAIIIDPVVKTELLALVRELCTPDLTKRGHPKGIGNHEQYSLERYVTRLDRFLKQTEIKIRLNKAQPASARKVG